MKLFGKSYLDIGTVAAELVVHDKQLLISIMDVDCNLHSFEFNPEGQPKCSLHLEITRAD